MFAYPDVTTVSPRPAKPLSYATVKNASKKTTQTQLIMVMDYICTVSAAAIYVV